MEDTRLAPTAGIVACALVLVALALPYAVASASAVGAYYAAAALSPLATALFALAGVIVFAAGRERRSDPALAAGAALVLGVFAVGVSLVWALSVRPDALGSNLALFSYHRWLVVGASLTVPVAGAWYARTLGLV